MSWLGHSMTLNQAAILIAAGMTATFVALYVVFSGFFAERRLNDRLEDLEDRTRTGKRTLQILGGALTLLGGLALVGG